MPQYHWVTETKYSCHKYKATSGSPKYIFIPTRILDHIRDAAQSWPFHERIAITAQCNWRVKRSEVFFRPNLACFLVLRREFEISVLTLEASSAV